MATNYAQHVSTKQTNQKDKIPGTDQIENSEGGYVYQIDKWSQLQRFLILGCAGGSYYANDHKLVQENADIVLQCLKEDSARVIEVAVQISDEGRALSNDPAIFVMALALTHADVEGRRASADNLYKVCRIGTHIFTFASYIDELRSWGKLVRRAVSNFYLTKDFEQLLYQITKYPQRGGWSHRNVLLLAHVKSEGSQADAIKFAAKGYSSDLEGKSSYLDAVMKVSDNSITDAQISKLIVDNKLPREVIPTEKLNSPVIWDALFQHMPLTALIRNLNKLTAVGVLKEGSFNSLKMLRESLLNEKFLKKSRIHPISLLTALKVYSKGQGIKGSLTWNPVPQVKDYLDEAFYLSFSTIEPTGKNYLLGIDVSGSMSCSCSGILTCAEISAVMAMVTARVEQNYVIKGFSGEFRDLGITPKQSLLEVMKRVQNLIFGATDCSLPMQFAEKNKIDIDTFCVYTDNETYYGDIHPSQALKRYRKVMNKPEAKLAVFGVASNKFSIADPKDPGMMDFVGFDPSAPAVLSDFTLGKI